MRASPAGSKRTTQLRWQTAAAALGLFGAVWLGQRSRQMGSEPATRREWFRKGISSSFMENADQEHGAQRGLAGCQLQPAQQQLAPTAGRQRAGPSHHRDHSEPYKNSFRASGQQEAHSRDAACARFVPRNTLIPATRTMAGRAVYLEKHESAAARCGDKTCSLRNCFDLIVRQQFCLQTVYLTTAVLRM